MRRYETIFILHSNLVDDQLTEFIEKISKIIVTDAGTVIAVDRWGLKKLAYLINKQNQGFYIYIDYAGSPAMVTEIERVSKIDDRVLKYMTVKLADACDPAAIIAELAEKREKAAAEAQAAQEEAADSEPEEAEAV